MDMLACCSCVLVSRQTSTRIDRVQPDRVQPLTENTKPTTAWAAQFRNCRVSQKLRTYFRLLCACVTVSPAGIPPWLRPRQWSNLWVFFLAFFGRNTGLKLHVPLRPFRNVAFGTGTAESLSSRAASHFFNSWETCGVQTAHALTVIQIRQILAVELLQH